MGKKTRVANDPQELAAIKRKLGLGRTVQETVPAVQNFVRLEKTAGSSQSIGADAQPNITWQAAQRDIGGGADIANNRFVVPEGRSGLWRMRVALHCSSATVDDNSNYRVVLTRNGSEMAFEHNTTYDISNTRAVTARCEDERYLDAGDVVTVQMENSTDATQPSPNVTVVEDSHVTFEFIGSVE